jgi:hypothetical protein
MRLLREISWVGPAWFYLHEVLDEFVEDGSGIVERFAALEEPAPEGALDAREGVAAIDEVTCADVGIEAFIGGMDGQGIDVVAEDFCAKVLLSGQPGQARQMFQSQAVLDPFEEVGDILPNNTRQPKS